MNLASSITEQEMKSEGFVTVTHSLQLLAGMNEVCRHVIAKSGDMLVGYALCMNPVFADEIPVLRPMFKRIDTVLEKGVNYMVMGQICIAKSFRKKGVFRALYSFMRDELQQEYRLIITEVDAENLRSLEAHYAIGFSDLLIYQSGEQNWHLIKWEL